MVFAGLLRFLFSVFRGLFLDCCYVDGVDCVFVTVVLFRFAEIVYILGFVDSLGFVTCFYGLD